MIHHLNVDPTNNDVHMQIKKVINKYYSTQLSINSLKVINDSQQKTDIIPDIVIPARVNKYGLITIHPKLKFLKKQISLLEMIQVYVEHFVTLAAIIFIFFGSV